MTHHELSLPSSGEQSDFARGSVFFVGTATVLLRYAGFTILTDPNFCMPVITFISVTV